MYHVGQKEIDAVARSIRSGKLFRYDRASQCARFERRYAKYLDVKHVTMTSSGSAALSAALAGVGIGPGDEVIVPAHTYMATAAAVLAVGAIPVIVDIDESITLDPGAFEAAIRSRTKAVIPVHMWGAVCDMKSIVRIARRHKLKIVEDACQCIGGAYEGKMVGTIGHAGAYSFNYFKHITCGEGGAVVTNQDSVARRALCMVDGCRFYWTDRKSNFQPFISSGSRASEIEGAMLNAQLPRLPGIIRALRRQKKRVLRETAESGLTPTPIRSPDQECAAKIMYLLPTAKQGQRFGKLTRATIAGQTGRHTYNEWDPILTKQGAHHPALDPFKLPQNRRCRMNYRKDMCPRSLDILNRTVMISLNPDDGPTQVNSLIRRIRRAAGSVL